MNIDQAYDFYKNYICNKQKFDLYKKHGFSINGVVSSYDWELFAAILLGDEKKASGCDLKNYEIKSSCTPSGFEYQYHKNTGLKKLEEEISCNHVFITYNNDYRDVSVRVATGTSLSDKFLGWRSQLVENYQTEKQRFRKSISFRHVCTIAESILLIENRELIYEKKVVYTTNDGCVITEKL